MAFGKKTENKSGGKRGKLPTKRSINLALTDEKPVNLKIGIPALILILLAAFAFGKFAVADRLVAVSRAEGQVSALQSELNMAYDKLNSFGELTDRGSAIALIRRLILPRGEVSGWTLSGNTLTVNMTVKDLQTVNRTVQDIESDEHVSFCTVNTAATTDKNSGAEAVNARVTIYLNPAEEVTRP